MRTSENVADLLAALSKAQGEFSNPERNRTVEVRTKSSGTYSFTYATFDAIIEMVRPVLTKHGLAFIQSPETNSGNVLVTTRLGHSSGQWLESDLAVSLGDDDGPQQIGSCITYLKRYSLCSMLGIAAEEDDDGNTASGNSATAKPRLSMPTCPKCEKSSGVIAGKEEYGGGWVCFAKKGGCGHKWHDAPPAEPPKTNGKKADPPGDPFEAAKSAVANSEWGKLLDLSDRIVAGTKITVDQKLFLLNAIAERGMNDAPKDAPPGELEAIVRKTTEARKELDHTFAQ